MELVSEHPLVEVWRAADGAQCWNLDVRPLLESGGEPYEVIMSAVRRLESGWVIDLHALFEPAPLIRQLARMSYATIPTRVGPDHWILRIMTAEDVPG